MYAQTYPGIHKMEEEEEEEITISLIMFEQRLRPRSGQLNLFNELGAKLIKFALLATRYVNCLNCHSRTRSNHSFKLRFTAIS